MEAEMACDHVWEFMFSAGEDAPGNSKDIVETCARCGAVRHDYRHNGGQTSPNYPIIRHLGPGSYARAILDIAEARLRERHEHLGVTLLDLREIARLARLLLGLQETPTAERETAPELP